MTNDPHKPKNDKLQMATFSTGVADGIFCAHGRKTVDSLF